MNSKVKKQENLNCHGFCQWCLEAVSKLFGETV